VGLKGEKKVGGAAGRIYLASNQTRTKLQQKSVNNRQAVIVQNVSRVSGEATHDGEIYLIWAVGELAKEVAPKRNERPDKKEHNFDLAVSETLVG